MNNEYLKSIPVCPVCGTSKHIVMDEVTPLNKYGEDIIIKYCECAMCKGHILISTNFINGKISKVTSTYNTSADTLYEKRDEK